MIIVRISAGLGNQMFQYMLVCALKERYPNETIKIDISDYAYVHAHTGYSLEKYFDIELEKADIAQVNQLRYIPVELSRVDMEKNRLRKWINGIRYKLALRQRKHLKKWNIQDGGFNIFRPEVFDLLPGDWYLNGYWQNPAYYQALERNISEYFPFKREMNEADRALSQRIGAAESVFVHVRRGDYVGSAFALCDEEYYRRAKEVIEQHVTNPLFVFFSDDISYVRDHFAWAENKVIVTHTAEDCDYDMQLMTQCKHGIMANSSFSYWAAMLKKRSGIVVCPRYLKVQDNRRFRMPQHQDWIYLDNAREG